jgi:hypothetical protein
MKQTLLIKTNLTLLLCLFYQAVLTQSISLPKESKFKFGDTLDWSNPSFNDDNWATQELGKSFRKDSSYAWYRIKIIIPSSMKTTKGKGFKLNLGKIDDADQTFFNGKLIGEMGTFPPNYTTQWDKSRVYTIPEKMVQWDKVNVIAVRVYNLVGGMGMWAADPYYTIEPIGWVDEVTVKQRFRDNINTGFISDFTLSNKTVNTFNGTIKYWIRNKDKTKILFTETKPVRLQGKAGDKAVITFPSFKSGSENVFYAGYQINDNNSNLFLKKEQLYIATYNLSIPVLKEVKPLVDNKVRNNFSAIPFQNQQFNGYLGIRLKQNLEQRLLKVDEDGLMGSYLTRPGIHPWQGEHVGKYLEAACNVWKLTHNPSLKKQMDRMMYVLINTQLEDGYLGTYTPDQYWTSWDVWSHKYNLHGLLAYYSTTGYKPALEACKKMGDLLCRTFGKKTGQRDIILAGEHVGMAATSILDAIVELYKYTSEKKYLDFCYYILDAWEQDNGPHIISAILKTGRVTDVGNRKAYEMLSNYVGLIKLYRLTGDEKMLKPVLLAWQDIVKNRLYITGTTSSWEHFQEDEVLPAAEEDHIGEGCVTTTWIQLNQNLLDLTGEEKYIEQIEKTIYNHLLGAENPEDGCVSYYTPLMGKKPLDCNISCCVSSVPRGIALIPYFTFGNVKNIPTVMLYEPALYKEKIPIGDGKNINLSLHIEGNFPENANATITVNTSQSAYFPIALRVPSWCSLFVAKIGDKEYKGTTGQYLTIDRVWKSGEKIKITFDIPIQILTGGKSYPGQIAFQRGPQVLSFDNSLNAEFLKKYQWNSFRNIVVIKPEGKNNGESLPKQWIGKQSYTVSMPESKVGIEKQQFIMVPFADASQTGGVVKVWMPLSIAGRQE